MLRRVLAARQVTEPDQLDQGLKAIHAPGRLANMDQAAALLEEQIAGGGRILLVGDFDADGATSVAVALRSLRAMGAGHVDYVVPNRFDFGYGLSPEIVDVAAERGPDLIITVDNGISSIDGVDAARARGIRVLVTDHHLPGERLPAADAIVNPNLPECGFPSKNLAGVGVIFYVMLALRARLRDRGWFTRAGVAEPRLADVLELVALGTVADVVPLDRNNRILVEQGLRRIRAGRACPGIVALLDVSGRDPRRAVASDLAFAVGPRLNAAGRLEDMSLGIECLLSDDPAAAHEMAVELDALNRQRRTIEGQMKAEAMAEVERMTGNLAADALPRGLCLLDEGWHQGVIGIVASRIKERFHRPVVAFAPAGDDELKGSARSVPGIHMRDLLEQVGTRNPGLIPKFGGHAMAAGLTLRSGDFDTFRDAFESTVADWISEDDLERVITTDGALKPSQLTMDLAEVLRHAGPWGQGFPEPLFDGCFHVDSRRIVGERHLKLRLTPADGGGPVDAIAFNALDNGWEDIPGPVQMVYRLDVNEFRGRRSLQLLVEYMEPAPEAIVP